MESVRPLLALALAASLGGPALCAQPQGRSVAAPSRAGSGPTAPLLNGTVVTYTLGTTQSGFPESVVVGVPNGASSSTPTPALILFHGYYEDPADLQVRTSFFDEALARGWFVIAPLGANIANFGIDYAQQNTEDALTYVWALHGSMIDAERVYGVGFSMGGGWASSYAARHVGNSDVRMAAQLIHTGTLSLTDLSHRSRHRQLLIPSGDQVVRNADFDAPLLFGPDLDPERAFRMRRSSTLHLDWTPTGYEGMWIPSLPNPDNINDEQSLGWNLRHTYQGYTWATDDLSFPLGVLPTQTAITRDWLQGTVGQVPAAPLSPCLQPQPAPANCYLNHCWGFLCEDEALDWLALHTLQTVDPTVTQELRIDADRQWHGFLVQRTGPLALARMRYRTDPATQELLVEDLARIATLGFDPADLGLDATPPAGAALFVRTEAAADGSLPSLRLTGLGSAPVLAEIEYDLPGGGTDVVTITHGWDPITATFTIQPVATSASGPATFNRLRLEF